MTNWWPAIGEVSALCGSALGLLWAIFSTLRRRNQFVRAGQKPEAQILWFLLNFVSMSGYLTLVVALGLASHYDLLPRTLFWYLQGLSALAFTSALLFAGLGQSHLATVKRASLQGPPQDPPELPVRQTA